MIGVADGAGLPAPLGSRGYRRHDSAGLRRGGGQRREELG